MTKFPLGTLLATAGVADFIGDDIPRNIALRECVVRHSEGDWGDVDPEDWETNNQALVYGSRLLSAYIIDGQKIWIITEADRSSTTIRFPSEY